MEYRKIKSFIGLMYLLVCTVFLTGCSTAELENRSFPLAIGVDLDGRDSRISYKFENLSKVAGDQAKGGQDTDFYIRSEDFFTGLSEYNNDSNKSMDYNHIKVLILGEDFFENREALENLIDISKTEHLIAHNTLLFLAEDAGGILALDENLDTSIGSYLQEMIESRRDYTLKDAVTVGDLYKECDNKEQTLFIPILKDEGGLPVVRNYYVMSQFEPKGEVSLEEAVLSYLCQGKLEKLSFSLEDGKNVSIERIKTKSEITKRNPLEIKTKISLEAKILNGHGNGEKEIQKIQNYISSKMTNKLDKIADNLLGAPKVDITNSYYRLGRYDRWAYDKFYGKPVDYLKELHPVFEVETTLVKEN